MKQTYKTYNFPLRGGGISPIRAIIRSPQKRCTAVAQRREGGGKKQKKKQQKKHTDNLDNSKCRGLDSFPNVNKAVSQLQHAAQYVNTTNKPISASHLGWQRFERQAVFYNKAAGHILNEA